MRIVVRGADVREEPLLDTTEAVAVEIRDPDTGELVAIMHRMGNSDFWGVTTNQDSDWENAKSQLGYKDLRPETDVKKRKDFFNL